MLLIQQEAQWLWEADNLGPLKLSLHISWNFSQFVTSEVFISMYKACLINCRSAFSPLNSNQLVFVLGKKRLSDRAELKVRLDIMPPYLLPCFKQHNTTLQPVTNDVSFVVIGPVLALRGAGIILKTYPRLQCSAHKWCAALSPLSL